MSPRLSLLLGTFMAEQRVRPIIERALSLDVDLELIVIDNASTDATFDVVRSLSDPRLVVSQNPVNIGALRNFDLLLQRARGDYIAYLADDDLVHSASLLNKINVLDRHPDIGLVFTRYDNRLSDGSLIDLSGHPIFPPHGYVGRTDEFESLLRNCYFMLTTVMIRRSALTEVSGRYGFDPRHILADWDLWLRLTRNTPTAYIAEAGIENAVRDTGGTADYLKLGYTVWGRLRIWHRFLVLDANPPVLYPRDWQEMWNTLANDALATWGQNAPFVELERRLSDIQRQYVDNATTLAVAEPPPAVQAQWLSGLVAALGTADSTLTSTDTVTRNLSLIARWRPVLSELAPGKPFAVAAPAQYVNDLDVWRGDIEYAMHAATALVKIGDSAAVIGWTGRKPQLSGLNVLLIAPAMDALSLQQRGLPLVKALQEVGIRADLVTAADVPLAEYDVVHVVGDGADLAAVHELRLPAVITAAPLPAVGNQHGATELAALYSRVLAAGAQWFACPDWADSSQWQPVVEQFLSAVGPDDRMTLHLYAGPYNGMNPASAQQLLDAYICAATPFADVLPDIRVSDVVPREGTAAALLLENIHDRRVIDLFGARRVTRGQWQHELLKSTAADCRLVCAELTESWPGPLELAVPSDFGVRRWWAALKRLLQVTEGQDEVTVVHGDQRKDVLCPTGKPFIAFCGPSQDLGEWRRHVEAEFDATTHAIDFDFDDLPPLLFGWAGRRLGVDHPRGLLVVGCDWAHDGSEPILHAVEELRSADMALDVTASGRIPTNEYDMVHMHAPWLGQEAETLSLVAAKMAVPSTVTTDAGLDWGEVARCYKAIWAARSRWFLVPDWPLPETWQPPLRKYLSTYTPTDNVLMQLYVARDGDVGPGEALGRVAGWLSDLAMDPTAIAAVEISDQIPSNRTTWAIASTVTTELRQAFTDRIVGLAEWDSICAAR